jgi:Mor family transcriptional regulator
MAGALSTVENRYPEELEAAAHQVAERLAALGTGRDDAARIGWEIAEHLRRFWGGRQIYIIARRSQPDPRQMGLLDSDNPGAGLAEQEILVDIAEQVEERLIATGVERDDAARMGWDIAGHLHAYWGGGGLYICKGLLYQVSLRDAEIYRRFNGENHDWLASEYNLTVQHVYRVIKRVGDAERAKRQGALFQ